MTIPAPPADNSGGYMIVQYSNGGDTHRMRLHTRPFGGDGTYLSPGAGTPSTVQLDFTGVATKIAAFYPSSWGFSLLALFSNNGDGTFTELFGWTNPTPLPGTGTSATAQDQTRATEAIFNFRDGHGGRGRISLIGTPAVPINLVPAFVAGASGGNVSQQLVDYITDPVKTNIVSHGGHQLQNPARLTVCVNRRLRRHYGYA